MRMPLMYAHAVMSRAIAARLCNRGDHNSALANKRNKTHLNGALRYLPLLPDEAAGSNNGRGWPPKMAVLGVE